MCSARAPICVILILKSSLHTSSLAQLSRSLHLISHHFHTFLLCCSPNDLYKSQYFHAKPLPSFSNLLFIPNLSFHVIFAGSSLDPVSNLCISLMTMTIAMTMAMIMTMIMNSSVVENILRIFIPADRETQRTNDWKDKAAEQPRTSLNDRNPQNSR